MAEPPSELPTECRAAETELVEHRRLRELDSLLPMLSGVLDLREVVEKVSEIARKALAHDLLVVTRIEEDGESVHVYAVAGTGAVPADESPRVTREEESIPAEPWDHTIMVDI